MNKPIIRVFPRRTSYTPDDELAFVGMPPLIIPEHEEVHVSCTFTWDKSLCEELAFAVLSPKCTQPKNKKSKHGIGGLKMPEYIKKEAVINFIENGLNNPDKTKSFGHDAIEIMAEVQYMPAADVSEVVRCKNCKNYELMKSNNSHFCNEFGGRVTEEDFCSRGSKKGR